MINAIKVALTFLACLLTSQFGLRAEPVTLKTSSGVLYGTLELPRGICKKTVPIALLIAGSGPIDRNGNPSGLGNNNSLQYLAESLAAHGIASMRYDKRGVAQSAKSLSNESALRFDNYVDDAVAWMKEIRRDKRFSTLTIIGHSEGSLIGMIAARQAHADAFVSIAGVGRPAGQVVLEQLKAQAPPNLMKQAQNIVLSLSQGKTVTSIPPELEVLFRASVQPYLISWFRFDAGQEIKKLPIPILIVQGTTDIQVGIADAKLLQKGQPKARLLIVSGMNHVFKIVGQDRVAQIKSYSDATLPIASQLPSEIVHFICSLKSKR